MGRTKKLFLGVKPIGGPTLKSRRVARSVTSKYHAIRNEQVQISQRTDLSKKDKTTKLKELNDELELMGGTNKYQQASIISTEFFKTSKWVLQTLDSLAMKRTCPSTKLKLLEVGAINIQLKQCGWMDVRSIDVNSQHPLIEECDFFTIEPTGGFNVVVCSMVVNCVTEPHKRGEMLARLVAHLDVSNGVLLLVLPLRCVNSKHVGGLDGFDSLLTGLGLKELLPKRLTPKLVFYTLGFVNWSNSPLQSGECSGDNRTVTNCNYVTRIRHLIAQNMAKSAMVLFTKDCSLIPPTEFSVSLADDLVPIASTSSKKQKTTATNK